MSAKAYVIKFYRERSRYTLNTTLQNEIDLGEGSHHCRSTLEAHDFYYSTLWPATTVVSVSLVLGRTICVILALVLWLAMRLCTMIDNLV